MVTAAYWTTAFVVLALAGRAALTTSRRQAQEHGRTMGACGRHIRHLAPLQSSSSATSNWLTR